jgi:hypothetical protein
MPLLLQAMPHPDDTIIAGPTNNNVNEVVNLLSSLFKIEDQGNISDNLGVQGKQLKDGSFFLAQPHLIDAILHDMHFQPMCSTWFSSTCTCSVQQAIYIKS